MTLPGTFNATPRSHASIAGIEADITAYFAGADIDVLDVLNRALSLAGLMITVSSDDNRACIQAVP